MVDSKSILVNEEVTSLIKRIPKTDLHVHLDGSVRMQTLIDIAKAEKIELPSYTVDGMNELVFKDSYADLVEYLKTFGYSTAVMQRAEHLERIAYEMALDNQSEGVRYMEVRSAPQLHVHKDLDMKTILASVNKGLDRSKKEFNHKPKVVSGEEPPFEYGVIVCALRSFGSYSEYYKNLFDAHPYSDSKSVFMHASMEMARGAVQIRDELALPIVAIDLAGAEAGNPARDHRDAFQFAHENFMAKTVHAGEAYGPPSIFQAISELHADRIGHGFYLFDTTKFDGGVIENRQRYIEALTQFIADRRVTIEVCLTSNLQTIPALGSLANHSFPEMLAHELSLTICTDNRTVSKTNVTKEILLAIEHFDITPKQLKNVIVYGFKRSFFPDSYSRKRNYVRRCINYYEKLVSGTVLDS